MSQKQLELYWYNISEKISCTGTTKKIMEKLCISFACGCVLVCWPVCWLSGFSYLEVKCVIVRNGDEEIWQKYLE